MYIYWQEVCATYIDCRHIVLNTEVDLKPHTLGLGWPTSRSVEIAKMCCFSLSTVDLTQPQA